MSKLIIKASEIANLTDARYFSARGVDFLGFSLDTGNSAYLPPLQINAIREWLSGPGIVADMPAFADVETITAVIETLKPDAVQIGQFTELNSLNALTDIPVIRELIPDDLSQLEDMEFEWRPWKDRVSFFLLNLEKNNFSWQEIKNNSKVMNQLKNLCNEYPVMLSLVFDSAELAEIITTLKPYGIGLKGAEEEKVGMKSFEALDEIFDFLDDLA